MSRAENRANNEAAILAAAREQIAEHGGVGLSMRAVAREVGMVSSAIYRYFPTRDALITAMVVESYEHLATALEEGLQGRRTPGRQWAALAATLREWAQTNPHEFQLLYGTPIPGYVVPDEAIAASETVTDQFLSVGGTKRVDGFTGRNLTQQVAEISELLPGTTPAGVAAVLAEFAALVGFVSMELTGHFLIYTDPADQLYDALVARQKRTLGLS